MEKAVRQIQALETITEEQWIEMWHKLRLHTAKKYRWLLRRLSLEPGDLANQAIVDTLQGRRQWPSINAQTGLINEDLSLFAFLCGVVRSNASHLWEREKANLPIENIERTNGRRNVIPQSLETILAQPLDHHLTLANAENIEQRIINNQKTERICSFVAEDKELVRVITELRKDPALKPRELAEILGLSIEKVRNAQKRLRRIVQNLRGDLTNGRH